MGRVLRCHGTTLGGTGTSVDPVGPLVGDNVGLPRTRSTMARRTPPPSEPVADQIVDIDITTEMQGSFLEYAY